MSPSRVEHHFSQNFAIVSTSADLIPFMRGRQFGRGLECQPRSLVTTGRLRFAPQRYALRAARRIATRALPDIYGLLPAGV